MVISRSNSEHIYGFNLTILLASAFCIRKGTTMYQNGQSFFSSCYMMDGTQNTISMTNLSLTSDLESPVKDDIRTENLSINRSLTKHAQVGLF